MWIFRVEKQQYVHFYIFLHILLAKKTITYNHPQTIPQTPSGNSAKAIAIDPESHCKCPRKCNRSMETDL